LTLEEAKLIDDLFNEFGGTIPDRVLQYLVRWLGASKLTEAMIRCLYQTGHLNLSSSVYTSIVLESKYESVLNVVVHNLNPNDLEGAWKDNNPGEVDPKSIKDPRYVSGANHNDEVNSALEALKRGITSLDNKLVDL